MSQTPTTVHSKLREWRISRDWSQAKLAGHLGLQQTSVWAWEQEGREAGFPAPDMQRRLEVLTDGAVRVADWQDAQAEKAAAARPRVSRRRPARRARAS